MVPAERAYPHYQPQPELFDNLSANAGVWHYKIFLMLRTEGEPLLDFSKMTGLIIFPSFHTVLAILTVYAVKIRPVFLPVAILNAVVIVSTLPEGGHYLVDLLMGGAVSALGIMIILWEHSHYHCDQYVILP